MLLGAPKQNDHVGNVEICAAAVTRTQARKDAAMTGQFKLWLQQTYYLDYSRKIIVERRI